MTSRGRQSIVVLIVSCGLMFLASTLAKGEWFASWLAYVAGVMAGSWAVGHIDRKETS